MIRKPSLLPYLLGLLVTVLLPLEASALVRQNPASGSFFAPEWETCRNDPVNNSDPLGLMDYSSVGGLWDNAVPIPWAHAEKPAEVPTQILINLMSTLSWGVENAVGAPCRGVLSALDEVNQQTGFIDQAVNLELALGPNWIAALTRGFGSALSFVGDYTKATSTTGRSAEQLVALVNQKYSPATLDAVITRTADEFAAVAGRNAQGMLRAFQLPDGRVSYRIYVNPKFASRQTVLHEYVEFLLKTKYPEKLQAMPLIEKEIYIEKLMLRMRKIFALSDAEAMDIIQQINSFASGGY